MKDEKYSRLVGMDERLEILKVRWQGCKIGRYSRLEGNNERLGILTFRR